MYEKRKGGQKARAIKAFIELFITITTRVILAVVTPTPGRPSHSR